MEPPLILGAALGQFFDRSHANIEGIPQGAGLGTGESQAGEVGPYPHMHVLRRRIAAFGKTASIQESGSGLRQR